MQRRNEMKKLIVAALLLVALLVGGLFGYKTAEADKEIVSVFATEYGVQITYADGTGYWYEY